MRGLQGVVGHLTDVNYSAFYTAVYSNVCYSISSYKSACYGQNKADLFSLWGREGYFLSLLLSEGFNKLSTIHVHASLHVTVPLLSG